MHLASFDRTYARVVNEIGKSICAATVFWVLSPTTRLRLRAPKVPIIRCTANLSSTHPIMHGDGAEEACGMSLKHLWLMILAWKKRLSSSASSVTIVIYPRVT